MTQDLMWFLDTLVRVRVAHDEGSDGLSVSEHRARNGDSPPLHVHETEDEIFLILEGEFYFQVADEQRTYGPGTVLLVPKGVPHTYRVDSSAGGHWLTITARGDFEQFVRAMGRPAERDELPPVAGPPSHEAAEKLAVTAARYGIKLVGPPLQ